MQLLRMPLSPGQVKKGSATEAHKGLVIPLLGLVVLFQVLHHMVISSKLQTEDGLIVACGDGSTAASDQQCIENKLFRSWAAAAPALEPGVLPESEEDLDELLVPGPSTPGSEQEDEDEAEETVEKVLSMPTTQAPPLSTEPSTANVAVTTSVVVGQSIPVVGAPPASSIVIANAGKVHRWGNLTPWAQGLVDLQAKMEAQMRSRRSSRKHRGHALDTRNKTSLLDEIMQVGREMCLQPHRHDYAACVRFLGNSSTPEQQRAVLDREHKALADEHRAWEQAFSERLTAFGRELCSEPQRKHYPSCVRFLSTSTLASVNGSHAGYITPWAKGLLELQATMDAKMNTLPSARQRKHDATSATSTPAHTSVANVEAEKSTLEEIMDTGREMCLQPHRRSYASCAYFLASNVSKPEHERAAFDKRFRTLEESREAWEKNFSAHVKSFGEELCSHPARRGYASCAQFLSSPTIHADPPEETGEGRLANATNLSLAESIAAFGRELCSEPHRKDYVSCAKFRQPSVKAPAAEALPTLWPGEIHWRRVKAWTSDKGRNLRGTNDTVVYGSRQLRETHWSGMIPKVACITVIPCGKMAQIWMKHFIKNFWMQNYEGPRELVLVYHHEDAATAKLVAQYANGVSIKAVPAMSGEYPSAVDFRFGAWKSDADVVARWDFDVWHHTKQLSMQVRALALSGRPASVLKGWTIRSRAGGETRTASGGGRADAALVGEASWMQRYWYPFLSLDTEENTARSHRHHVVQVDMPTLNIYDEDLYDIALAKGQCQPKSTQTSEA